MHRCFSLLINLQRAGRWMCAKVSYALHRECDEYTQTLWPLGADKLSPTVLKNRYYATSQQYH